jgi:hypothetical protein
MEPYGWQFSFDHSVAVVQITLISASLCFSLGEGIGFPAFWNETFLCF